MYILYLDASGTPEASDPSNRHYVLVGVAVPETAWSRLDAAIRTVHEAFALVEGRPEGAEPFELHAGWINTVYHEQQHIAGFDALSWPARYAAVMAYRTRQQETEWPHLKEKARRAKRKFFDLSEPFVHLTREERNDLMEKAAGVVAAVPKAALFGAALDKAAMPAGVNVAREAFAIVLRQFEHFLRARSRAQRGIVMMDRDDQVEAWLPAFLYQHRHHEEKHERMRCLIEAPFFVDSKLSGAVQIADVCSYVVRRYLDGRDAPTKHFGHDEARFTALFPSFHRDGGGRLDGLVHRGDPACACAICAP